MRAARFPLQLPLEFRPLGERVWQQAQTANVSASGVLVRVPHPPEVDTRIEFRMMLASREGDTQKGEVAGTGRIVRVIAQTEREEFGFAVAIDCYELRPSTRMAAS